MSEIFLSGNSQDVFIGEMSSRRARLFVALTEVAASIYNIEAATVERIENAYFVHPEAFCLLVDRVFEWPIDLLYSWSHYATGFYESIVEETLSWEWRAGTGGRDGRNLPIIVQPVKWSKEAE